MYGDLLLDQLGVNFLGPAPLDLELLHMLTTFHWNASHSTLGWWFCHNNTMSCNENFWVEQVTVPHPPPPLGKDKGWGRTRRGGGGGTTIFHSIRPPQLATATEPLSASETPSLSTQKGCNGRIKRPHTQDACSLKCFPSFHNSTTTRIKGGVFAQRGHSAGTAPIITVIIQVTTLKTSPPAESCTINSKLENSNI